MSDGRWLIGDNSVAPAPRTRDHDAGWRTNKKKRASLRKKRRERDEARGENEGNVVGGRGVKDEQRC